VYAERAGANAFEGGVDGTTNQDRTNYFATVPAANLENVLWFESDRLATLTDVTTKEKLDNQRDVVKNERRQGLENEPYGRDYPLLTEAVFPKGHPYSWPVIGSQEDLTAASLDDVKEFFKTLHAEQPLARHCGRLRAGRGEETRREVLRRYPTRPGARSAGQMDSARGR
jgi:predicted Zn-dependent peptidase